MKLIWKIIREHLSIGQLISFLLANVVGLSIIMLGIQLYMDITPIITSSTDFLKPEYVVISKPVNSINTLTGKKPTFSRGEQDELAAQPFVSQMGLFRAAQYGVYGGVNMGGMDISTEMFFESVPDAFVDVVTDEWHFSPDDELVPIVIPRDYLSLYNFGFAQTSDMMPAVSEKLLSSITIDLMLYNQGRKIDMEGRIVGLSNRINTILVPESFIQWSNAELAADTLAWEPARIIIEVDNPADKRVANYMHEHKYAVANDKLDASKATWFLHLLVSIVMVIGLIICVLACYVLILSIFLLLQKNTKQMRDLVLLGYAHRVIARPYWCIVMIVNMVAWLLAGLVTWWARGIYLPYLKTMSTDFSPAAISSPLLFTGGLMVFLVLVNSWLVFRRIRHL